MEQSSNLITALLLAALLFPAATTQTQFIYSGENFNQSDSQYITVSKDATINNQCIQLTPDTIYEDTTLGYKSGRAMFNQKFKFWEDNPKSSSSSNGDILISFNSTFLINVFPASPSKIPAEGLSFVIAPDLEIPWGSEGGFLGLTNRVTDGNSSNRFVAIELDTFKQSHDPNDNHMGLNINSVRSIKTVDLTQYGIIIAPVKGINYTVWVQYDGKLKLLQVFMAQEGIPKPVNPLLNETINLKDYVNQYSYMGFTGSTGHLTQVNCILKWNLTVDILPDKKDRIWLKILLGVGLGVALLVILLGGLWYYWYRSRVVDDPKILGAVKNLPGTPSEFLYKELKKATNNFDDKMKLGQGGFGVVYKGILATENKEVAVKKFSRDKIKSKEDFISELTIINRLRHKHLVKLEGWCHKNGKLLLVYEFMTNGSLDDHLFDDSNKILSWEHRFKIVFGVASALNYLHNEYDQKVVHRDLKASNIMLDSDFNARLGDFGLARAIENERTSYAELEGVPGTIGYIAPECFHTGKATRESDAYGFGAVLLEVVCGERPWAKICGFNCLVDWVWKLYREGNILEAVDKRLGDDFVHEVAQKLLLLGLACSHPIASERPKTQVVLQIISGSMSPPYVPPFKPAFVWPNMEPMEERSMTITTDETPMTSSYYGNSGLADRNESRVSHIKFRDTL